MAIPFSDGIDVGKSNISKECIICHCWFFNLNNALEWFLNVRFKNVRFKNVRLNNILCL